MNPPEKPPTPDEIREEIEKLENDKFKISTKAIYEVRQAILFNKT